MKTITKKTYNPIINKAKDYVYRNIHEKNNGV